MTENQQKTWEENYEEIKKRLQDGFCTGGSMLCENKCGQQITVTTFSVFVFPDFKGILVCSKCAKDLYHKHNYGNKN